MANYYVATAGGGGNNGNTGAIDSPWLTVQYGVDHIGGAGDTLYIRGGTYVEEVVSTKNGTSGSRITICSYPSETAIISGNKTIPINYDYFLVTVSGNYTTIKNLSIIDSKGALLMVDGNYSNAENINGNFSYESGIIAWGDHNIIDGCIMTDNGNGYGIGGQDSWGSAIATGGSNTTIQNCTSYENHGEGLNAYNAASNVIMQDNVSYNNEAYNLYLDSTSGGTIRRNLVYQTKPEYETDGICIGGETGQASSLYIYNNLVTGCRVNFVIDSNVPTLRNVHVWHNTFVNGTGDPDTGYNMGVYYHDETTAWVTSSFKNNIVIEEAANRTPIDVEAGHSGLVFDYNCWNKTPDSDAVGAHDVVGNPLIAKTGPTGAGTLTKEYFRIKAGSPCIDKGAELGIDTDFEGNPRS